ncbi:TPA: hypothetical protein JLE87_004984 [Escherichia coli]|nr:hypothetical protein [Escherichia coli]MXE43744.1 hypothetical protein [Escherichia sp. HH41S]ELT9994393.1 hypothetical protein [Escherichia coli]HAV8721499.1 hypothetical protein [Escherichia coli]HAV9074622.1 hypothetical protein [Escherichia coli]
MEFKDLPKEIQTIAATTLGDSLVKIDPAYTKKETIDNMVRNVRNAFSGLYGSDNQKQESDVNKRVISVCVNGHVLSSIKTETATVFDCLCIVQSLVDALFRSVNLENDANLRGRTIAHPYAHTLGSVDAKNNTLQVSFEHSPQELKTKKEDADKNNNDESDLFIISSNLLEVMKSELEIHNIKPTPVYLRWVMRIIDASLP